MLGAHAGQDRFTDGPARSMGIASSDPLYVSARPERNLVVVGPRSALATSARRGHLRRTIVPPRRWTASSFATARARFLAVWSSRCRPESMTA